MEEDLTQNFAIMAVQERLLMRRKILLINELIKFRHLAPKISLFVLFDYDIQLK